jgi:N-acetylmuramoyl-L-alanine amidase-like protein
LIASRALLRSVAVVPFRLWLTTAFVSGVILGTLLGAQVDAEEKSRHEESEQSEAHSSPSPKPKKSPGPVAKASRDKSAKKHKATARNASHSDAGGSETPEKAPTAIPHAKLANDESQEKTDPSEKKSPTPIRKAKPKSDDEEEATPRPTPRESAEPAASSKSKRHHTPTPKPKSKKSKEVSRKTKKAGKSKSARNEETPRPEKTPPPPTEEGATVSERAAPTPKTIGAAAPTPSPERKGPRASSGERAQVVIEKSGLEEDQGLEPPPSPPPKRGFWPWSRSSGNYRYLTRSVIDAIRRAPVKRRRWQFIVVHNSGTRQGNARVFDYYHRHVRRMQNGLAYHFVIGNGTSTGNGQVEVGDRWRRQINGGHVHSDYLNNISLGICLVGDFNRGQPTRAQLDACEELIRYLRDRCGKTDRGAIPVRPHREMNPPRWPTDCPGDDFPYSWFRRF